MTNNVTAASGSSTATGAGRNHRSVAILFFVLSAAGLIGSWYFNLQFTGSPSEYLNGWFDNTASSAVATDAIVAGLVSVTLILVEGARVGLAVWARALLVVASFGVAVAFALPLFLGLRELKLAQRS